MVVRVDITRWQMAAALDLYFDTSNKRLVGGLGGGNAPALPDFTAGDTGQVVRLHPVKPVTNSVNRVYGYIALHKPGLKLALGLVEDLPPTGGTFALTDSDAAETTSALAYNVTPAALQAEIRSSLSTNYANATVTGSDGGPYTVDRVDLGAIAGLSGVGELLTPDAFVAVAQLREGAAGASARSRLTLIQSPPSLVKSWSDFPTADAGTSVAERQAGSLTANAMYRVSLPSDTYEGSWTLTMTTLGVDGDETKTSGSIAYDASGETVKTAIEANFGSGNGVTVTKVGFGIWDIELTGAGVALKAHTVPTVDVSGLSVPIGYSGTMNLNNDAAGKLAGNEDVKLEIEETTAAGEVVTHLKVPAKIVGQVIDPSSIGATSLPNYLSQSDLRAMGVPFAPGLTGRTGGTASDLDSLPTAESAANPWPQGSRVIVLGGEGPEYWRQVVGDVSETGVAIVNPDDKASQTTKRYWLREL